MSFARGRAFAALHSSVRLLQASSSTSARSLPVTRRFLSTTACIRQLHGLKANNTDLESDMKHLHHHRSHDPKLFDQAGRDLNPYRQGPSAVDKAVHLFFLTEIMRGVLDK